MFADGVEKAAVRLSINGIIFDNEDPKRPFDHHKTAWLGRDPPPGACGSHHQTHN